jgi:hypothetical protein
MTGRAAIRVGASIVAWMGIASAALGVGGAVLFRLLAAPCPPESLCEGPALLMFIGSVVAGGGVVVALVGFVVRAMAGGAPREE